MDHFIKFCLIEVGLYILNLVIVEEFLLLEALKQRFLLVCFVVFYLIF